MSAEQKAIEIGEEEGRALLIGIYSGAPQLSECEESLKELESLADTFGIETVGKLPVAVRKLHASTYLPKGKLDDVLHSIGKTAANLLIFDEEISPAQQRNCEKVFKIAVMDRTELILEIFAQRAQTREARLQVELARTRYQFPRLKRLWSHFSRQRARGGYLRGAGEKQIEVDRRLLKRRLERLTEELEEVKRYRQTQSTARRRSGIPTFAIIGYTNAGKSTLLNALTEADVFVEDKLFATLDPTTRKFTLPNRQEVLLTDTVGFIKKLPHTLIAAFRSTLESALQDDVLLHVIDISHPRAELQAQTTLDLLKELKVDDATIITVLNKEDQCQNRRLIDKMRLQHPRVVLISAKERTGFKELVEMMLLVLRKRSVTVKLKIPQEEYALVALLKREAHLLYEEYEKNDVIIRAEIPMTLLHRFDSYVYENQP
jgi:GTPase